MSKRLLIVDDSRVSRMIMRSVLNKLRPEWQLLEAGNAQEAIALVVECQPNFITMDINMPGQNGLEAAGQLKTDYPELKIALCTANIQKAVQEAAARDHLFFVAKPITEENVSAALAYFEGEH